jgi:hypothetical protein
VIEEAQADGWKPASETSVEETPTEFRYTVMAPKGQVTKASLVLERTDSQTVILTTLAAEDMLARIRGLQNESAAVKDAVARLGSPSSTTSIRRARSARSLRPSARRSPTTKTGSD